MPGGCCRLFVELHKSGTAVVIATHDLSLMDQFGYARRLVVGDGQLRVFEGRPAMNDADAAIPADSQLKRDMPLVPADSIAGRALVVVIAIMTFLACLTAGGAILVGEASQAWRGDVSRDVTIQIKPRAGEDVDALVAAAAEIASRAPGVADAIAYTKAQSEAMLAPWLGDGVDLGQLPIPRLIVVHMQPGHRDDLEPLARRARRRCAGSEP